MSNEYGMKCTLPGHAISMNYSEAPLHTMVASNLQHLTLCRLLIFAWGNGQDFHVNVYRDGEEGPLSQQGILSFCGFCCQYSECNSKTRKALSYHYLVSPEADHKLC